MSDLYPQDSMAETWPTDDWPGNYEPPSYTPGGWDAPVEGDEDEGDDA